MLIGVISDSHDNVLYLKKAVDFFNDKNVEVVLHAGDIISPFCANELSRLKSKVIAVFGNNDGEKTVWRQKIKSFGEIHEGSFEFELDGKKILMMHVPHHIEHLANSEKYDYIIYGHTHKRDIRKSGRTTIINPGEAGAWITGKSTVAIINTAENTAEISEILL